MREQLSVHAEISIYQKMEKSRHVKLGNSVKEGKIPKLSIENQMGFPELPPQLKLYSMEERLIAPRIVFMLLQDHPGGGQTFVRGNFVNVPVDIAPTV